MTYIAYKKQGHKDKKDWYAIKFSSAYFIKGVHAKDFLESVNAAFTDMAEGINAVPKVGESYYMWFTPKKLFSEHLLELTLKSWSWQDNQVVPVSVAAPPSVPTEEAPPVGVKPNIREISLDLVSGEIYCLSPAGITITAPTYLTPVLSNVLALIKTTLKEKEATL